MKIAAALVLLAAQCLVTESRPDVLPSQQVSNDADSSVLPPSNTREGKEAYTEGEMIPVQLIYGSDHETEATVKEVSVESMMRSSQSEGKRRNRVTRSPADDNNPHSTEMYADSFGGEHDSKPKNYWSWLTEDAGSFLGSNPDEVNQALGIQARGASDTGEINEVLGQLSLRPSPNDVQNGIRRRIQHFQTFMVPVFTGPPVSMPPGNIPLGLPQSSELFDEQMRHEPVSPVGPLSVFPPAPYNAMWSTFTNIIEYGQESNKKEGKSRRKRDSPVHNYEEVFIDDFARSGEVGPHITKLKVRRGGVAIAGPGGIATAGSGGTAIVGPGGTAYTTQDGTAVVGPGGRVVELPPGTSVTEIIRSRSGDGDDDTSSNFVALPPGARIVATGPVVYYKGLLPYLHAPVPPPIVERL